MVAAKANALPRPIKWFSIPRCYRAERPQKGRLREFIQWNVDMLGGDTPDARRQFDLETAALCLDCLREFGLSSSDVQLLWNDRSLVEHLFTLAGLPPERFPFGFHLLDRLAKLSPEQRRKQYADNQIPSSEQAFFEQLAAGKNPLDESFWTSLGDNRDFLTYQETILSTQAHIEKTLALMGLPGYAKYDPSIVRGLAYYTGFVWEVADTSGGNRAVAGGGRYDKLIEMFGGPSLPATGFGMGDVVLAILLQEKNKLPATAAATPHVFLINALESPDIALQTLATLRKAGLTAVSSYKATKNIGKLLEDAGKSGAKFALILAPAEAAAGQAKLKNLQTREEREIPLTDILNALRA
jgi:histidyl-tRNA synthetase